MAADVYGAQWIAAGVDGSLYVMTWFGAIVRLDPVPPYTQTDVTTGRGSPRGLAAGPSGDLYVLESGSVVRVDPFDGAQTKVTSGGSLSDGRDIAVTVSGEILVQDQSGGLVRIDPATGVQHANPYYRGADQIAVSPPPHGDIYQDYNAYDTAVGADGAIYVADGGYWYNLISPLFHDGRVVRVDPVTHALQVVCESGLTRDPRQIVATPQGDLVVTDGSGGLVLVDPQTGAQSTNTGDPTNTTISTASAATVVDPGATTTLTTPDGALTVSVPPGAVDGPATLTVLAGEGDFQVVGRDGYDKLAHVQVLASSSFFVGGSQTYAFPAGTHAAATTGRCGSSTPPTRRSRRSPRRRRATAEPARRLASARGRPDRASFASAGTSRAPRPRHAIPGPQSL